MANHHSRVLATTLALASALMAGPQVGWAETLSAPRYAADGQLQFPDGTDRWIVLGSVMGGRYADEPFDPAHPPTMGVIQMEPSAYDYFQKHGEYADGTMLLLSFYESESKSDPQLSGFVQGPLLQQEIHVIDKARFEEKRAFFVFPREVKSAVAMPRGSECVMCHTGHGAFDGTFTQFYPVMRDRLAGR